MSPEAQRIAIAEVCKSGYYVLPNYLHDLNAMHEAEKVLTEFQLRDYGSHLQEILRWFIVGYIEDDYKANLGKLAKIAHATAAQRAEAFLRTLGLWKE